MPRKRRPDLDMAQINIDAEEAGLDIEGAVFEGAQKVVKRALRGSGIRFTSDIESRIDQLIDESVFDIRIDIQNLVHGLLTGN